jgi:RimJ/RimL family protein N-acetyltransferase
MSERSDPDPLTPLPGEWSRATTLRDGTSILLRQIRPSDRDRLATGLQELSAASRYLRFQAPVERLSEAQLDYLTDVDHRDHEAVVAVDLDRPERPGVGVARYIREPFEPTVAEAAITVADEYHGQGAGTVLLGALAGRAREEGVEVFRSYVVDGNAGMLEVFDHLGARRELEDDGMWRVDLDVPVEEGGVPSSAAGRAFLEVARDERTLADLLPALWARRPRRGGRDLGSDPTEDRPEGEDPAEAEDPMLDELEELRGELDGWLRERDDR